MTDTIRGWQLVPVVPTSEMLAAVDGEADEKHVARGRAMSAWVSMLKAAPEPPIVSVLGLALSALNHSGDLVRSELTLAEQLYGKYQTRQARIRGLQTLADDHADAIVLIETILGE